MKHLRAATTIARVSARSLLVAFAILGISAASSVAHAILPEGGWYWNPNESGRGFNLEIQDNVLFIAAFAYRTDGSQVWYVAGGPMSSDRQFTGDLLETLGGQCFGCTYRAATGIPRGSLAITFTSERAATISLLGTTVNVVRQDWSGVGTLSREALYGEWATTEGDTAFPIYYGERITLNAPFTFSGIAYASGNRTGDTTDVALGAYDASLGSYYILLDSSTSYYRFYVFTPNAFNHFEGLTWLYLKTSTLSGNGTFVLAHRTRSSSRVRNGVGPGVSKARASLTDRDEMDARQFAQQAKLASGVMPDAAILDRYRTLAGQLEAQLRADR